MAKTVATTRPVGLFQFPGLIHLVVVIVVSIIEVIGLVTWLSIHTGGNPGSVLGFFWNIAQVQQAFSVLGRTRFAAGILGVFLVVEHVITQIDQAGRLSGKAFLEILVFSSLESIIWVVWLLLIPINGLAALAFFLVTLFVEHQIADNVKKGLPFLNLAKTQTRVFQGIVILTIAEVVGAAVWVAQASVIALAVTALVEHYIARNVGQIRE